MAIRNPLDWAAIYHLSTKGGKDDLAFAKRVLDDLTHYTNGGFSDDDARTLANAFFAFHRCQEPAVVSAGQQDG